MLIETKQDILDICKSNDSKKILEFLHAYVMVDVFSKRSLRCTDSGEKLPKELSNYFYDNFVIPVDESYDFNNPDFYVIQINGKYYRIYADAANEWEDWSEVAVANARIQYNWRIVYD